MGVALAVPDCDKGFITIVTGSFARVVSTVNGVPPVAADVTETVLAIPGIHVGVVPTTPYAQVTVTGAATRALALASSALACKEAITPCACVRTPAARDCDVWN